MIPAPEVIAPEKDMELPVPASEAMVSEKEIEPSVLVSYATAPKAEALRKKEISPYY